MDRYTEMARLLPKKCCIPFKHLNTYDRTHVIHTKFERAVTKHGENTSQSRKTWSNKYDLWKQEKKKYFLHY